MSKVRIVNKHGQGITVDVIGMDTTSAAAGLLADFMRTDCYFTGESHPHNQAVRTLLVDEAAAAATTLEGAQARLWEFDRNTAGD